MLRRALGDGIFHVYARGVAGESIFLDDADRQAFVKLLAETVKRSSWDVWAFCLMTTHYHLVVDATQQNLSRGLHRLNSLYAMRVNRKYARFGHLFADRFSCRKLTSERGAIAVCRYVVLNPVRAGMVDEAWQWQWSGWRWGPGVDVAA